MFNHDVADDGVILQRIAGHILAIARLLHAAMGRLGWSPAGTWAATPRELAFALGLRRGAGALNRRGLEALMQRFPDEGGTGWQTKA